MSTGETIGGIAANLIVAGIVFHLKGPSAGTVCLIAGFALMIVAYVFRKKPQPVSSQPASQTQDFRPHVEVKQGDQIFSPTIHVSSGSAAPAPAPDHAYNEVLAFLERTRKPGRAVMYFVEHIAAATGLAEPEVARVLERLYDEEHVYRRSIEGIGTDGTTTRWGYVYWYAHF
jgi:hypothetical protein